MLELLKIKSIFGHGWAVPLYCQLQLFFCKLKIDEYSRLVLIILSRLLPRFQKLLIALTEKCVFFTRRLKAKAAIPR